MILRWLNNQSIIIKDKDGDPAYIIDTLIEHKGNNTLIDYKTNDMTHGVYPYSRDEHGNQLERYVKSQNTLRRYPYHRNYWLQSSEVLKHNV
jgi:ATP-dependent exoDNAse (exonuclease V) beta subunit